ncbi:hypothetical protein ACW7BC_29000 [Azospirillum argentinense]
MVVRVLSGWGSCSCPRTCHDRPTPANLTAPDGLFIPTEIAWVVERSLSWLSRYRWLNVIFERTKAHLIGFVEIAFVSILSRRLRRLTAQDISA